jgi:MOSC domain-containing protein YiiM
LPEVSGIIAQCYSPPPKEELEARKGAGWNWAAEGRFIRRPVPQLEVGLAPAGETVPPSHDALFGVSERALLCQTAEGYQKLRGGLPPHTHRHLSPDRPGSGENIFVDGLEQWALCIGDEFEVSPSGGGSDNGGARLQLSSPRRPCERWNEVHGGDAAVDTKENVRHFCMTNTLGGVFFRVVREGKLRVGDTLTLVARPHPQWTVKRIGDMLYSGGGVAPEAWPNWQGTEQELRECIEIPQLANIEWKAVMKSL